MLPVNGGDMPYPSHLLECVGVHGLLRQEAVRLAQPSLQLVDGFMRLLLGCTMHLVNLGFEVSRSAL